MNKPAPSELSARLPDTLLLIGAIALLVVVLLPGLGHEVNGATRWCEKRNGSMSMPRARNST